MSAAIARTDENALAAAKELGLEPDKMNEVYRTYFNLARTLDTHACALAIIKGEIPADPDLIKKVLASDYQKNKLIEDALYRRWFPQCRTVSQLSAFLTSLDPQRRYMRAKYIHVWCDTYLNDNLPMRDLVRLAQISPQGSDDEERLISTIFRVAGI